MITFSSGSDSTLGVWPSSVLRAETGIWQLQADYGTFKCVGGKPARTPARWRGAYGECSGYVGGQKEGHWGLGTWRGLSHLDLTGLRGWVTTGHTASGPPRPEKLTQPFFYPSLASTRVFPHARLPGVLNQHLPDSDYSPLAVAAAFIHSAVSGAITPVAFLWVRAVKKTKKKNKGEKTAFGSLWWRWNAAWCDGGSNAPHKFKNPHSPACAR